VYIVAEKRYNRDYGQKLKVMSQLIKQGKIGLIFLFRFLMKNIVGNILLIQIWKFDETGDLIYSNRDF